MRLRVDGEIYDIDDVPPLAKTAKHTIDVVVDRFKVQDDLGNRVTRKFGDRLATG